jgi:hypothetical protein
LQGRLDEAGSASPRRSRQRADVAALDEAEPTGAAGDLRELPRQQVAPGFTVELRRLREEQRLAREVDAVPQHVGRHRHVRASAQEAVDLLTPRAQGHRAVEHGDAAGVEPVDLAREREHGAAAERHDDRPWREAAERALADELERQDAARRP